MKPFIYNIQAALVLFMLLVVSAPADLGLKLGSPLTGDRIGKPLDGGRISQSSFLVKERKIRDVVDHAKRKKGTVTDVRTERLKTERETAERIKNKKKKVINAN